jgi:hypothetical protein
MPNSPGRRSRVLFRANVLDVEREERRRGLWQMAILTAVTRPLTHELANPGIHHEAAFRSNRVRACACKPLKK